VVVVVVFIGTSSSSSIRSARLILGDVGYIYIR